MPAKSKKQSKARKLVNWFKPTSPAKSVLLFAFVFAVAGGGYFTYRGFAYSVPPSNMMYIKSLFNVKAVDGVIATVECASVLGSTVYGPIANCIQTKPGSNFSAYRNGYYSPLTKYFSPNGSWLNSNAVGIGNRFKCRNMDYYFVGTKTLQTPYGPAMHGQIFRYYRGIWQIKWAALNQLNYYCYPNNVGWMNAKAW